MLAGSDARWSSHNSKTAASSKGRRPKRSINGRLDLFHVGLIELDWLIDCRPYSSPLFLYNTIIFLQWQFLVQSLRVRLVIWSLAFSCWVWSLEHDPLESWTRMMRKLDMSLSRRRFWPCGSFGCVPGCINGILWLCLFMKDKTKTNARKTIYSTLTPVKRNETKQTTTKQPQLIIRQYFWRDNKCELLLLKICRRIVENERANVGVFWGLCCCGLIDRCLMNIHSRNSFIHYCGVRACNHLISWIIFVCGWKRFLCVVCRYGFSAVSSNCNPVFEWPIPYQDSIPVIPCIPSWSRSLSFLHCLFVVVVVVVVVPWKGKSFHRRNGPASTS